MFLLLSALMSRDICYTLDCPLFFLVILCQKGGKETILEEEFEFKGIEEEEEEESYADAERNSAEGDKDMGKEILLVCCFFFLFFFFK